MRARDFRPCTLFLPVLFSATVLRIVASDYLCRESQHVPRCIHVENERVRLVMFVGLLGGWTGNSRSFEVSAKTEYCSMRAAGMLFSQLSVGRK